MTNPSPIPVFTEMLREAGETMRETSRQFNEGIAEFVFRMSAQSALGDLLAGHDESQARTRLQMMTDEQLDKLSHAAHGLANIIRGIIDDRNAEAIDRAEADPR